MTDKLAFKVVRINDTYEVLSRCVNLIIVSRLDRDRRLLPRPLLRAVVRGRGAAAQAGLQSAQAAGRIARVEGSGFAGWALLGEQSSRQLWARS
jgi:hypothetical protein